MHCAPCALERCQCPRQPPGALPTHVIVCRLWQGHAGQLSDSFRQVGQRLAKFLRRHHCLAPQCRVTRDQWACTDWCVVASTPTALICRSVRSECAETAFAAPCLDQCTD
jgi:hypothetical protein